MRRQRPPATAEEIAQMLEMRLGGASWPQIASRFGYASHAGPRVAVIRAVQDDDIIRLIAGHAVQHGCRLGSVRANEFGYLFRRHPSHPLASKLGRVYEHRRVLYDQLGDGPHNCVTCGRPFDWNELTVDHINHDRADNRPENLQALCNPCHGRLSAHSRWRPGIDFPAWMADPDCPDDFEGMPWERAA